MIQAVSDYLDKTRERYPDKLAYADNAREVTFQQLYDEAIHVADALVSRDLFKSPVLLYMDKSVSLISCFTGVAYSGNLYSPIDTKMPVERINKIIQTLDPAAVITDREHISAARGLFAEREILVFEDLMQNNADEDKVRCVRKRIIDTDILYVLFTSGSTGTPKGVTINHRAVIDFTEWISDCYHFDETTVFGNQAQLYFDLSIQDVYGPLRNGSATILIPNRLYSSPVRVWKTVIERGVNTLVWIPSMLSLFADLDVLEHMEKAPLRTVLFCGEVMPVNKLNYWIRNYPDAVYANLYGPTECTEACTYYTIDRGFGDDELLPIGRPCNNCDAVLLDENGNAVTEIGITGELCIRGTCLSSGYYGDLTRTNEVFVQNPLNKNYPELIYKTGDIVKYNDDHELVYVCRKDHQVKVRGYRVELGEIESAALSVDRVLKACCLFDKENEKIILVYTGDITKEELALMMADLLQDYMMPGQYIRRDSIPLNDNGKTDRTALAIEYL